VALDPVFDRRRSPPSGEVKVVLSQGPKGFGVEKVEASFGKCNGGYALEATVPWEVLGWEP